MNGSKNTADDMTSHLRIENLAFSFAKKHILQDISFSLAPGEALVLLGASGVGKTTLLRLLAGLLEPNVGKIEMPFDGERPGSRLVFQEARLFPWMNVQQNIAFALRAAEVPRAEWQDRMMPLLQLVGLGDSLDLPIQTLSGGMAQRIALVRGLCVQPAVLLLDEPFSSLDPRLREQLQQVLVRLMEFTNVSVVMVSHDVEEALYVGDQLILLAGEPASIVLQCSLKERQDTSGLKAQIQQHFM